jgi:Fic family protein
MKVPQAPPSAKALALLYGKKDFFSRILGASAFAPTIGGDNYAHWDRLRFHTPPGGLTHEEWWAAVKAARLSSMRFLPCGDASGTLFRFSSPDPLQRYLSEADRDLSGRVPMPDQLLNPGTRDRYRISASIEEAITSSQLEGASTTRKVATEMLRSGRKPNDKSERMIFNNYQAIRAIRKMQSEPLTPDAVLRVHKIVTDQTLDDPTDGGRLRTTDDVKVYDNETGEVLHSPPPHGELAYRLRALCDFANEKKPEYYVHPLVRAILLHFFLAYDHPFVDGNGRTARALFYWSMARSGYWLCEYLSISHFLRKAPAAYAMSYLYTETDENDVTYFILSQLETLKKSIDAMHDYVRVTMRAMNRAQSMLRQSHAFNHRQLAILAHAMQHPDASYTATSHANSHQVTRQTARTDLKELAELRLLSPLAVGNGFVFAVPPDLEDRLESFGKKRT